MLEKRPIVTIAIGYMIGIIIGLYCKISVVLLYLIIYLIAYFINYLKKILKNSTINSNNNILNPAIPGQTSHNKVNKQKFKQVTFRRYFRYIKIIITKKVLLIIIISSVISNSIVLYQNNKYEKIYSNLDEKEVDIVATVVSNKKEKTYKDTYKIKYKNMYFYLDIKRGSNIKAEENNTQIKYGDKIKILGKYEEPAEASNYGGFNYKEYLKTKKIYGTIEASEITILNDTTNIYTNEVIENIKISILKISNNVFLQIKELIQENFEEKNANILLGVILGYTDEFDEEIRENLTDSNMSHILAVSGMHIAYIVLLIKIILEKPLGKRICRIFTILILIFYMFITGLTPSVVRAVTMVCLATLAKIIYRKSDIWQNLSIAILTLLINNPFAIKSVSALLSFVATIGIVLMQKYIGKSVIKLSFVVSVSIAPILAVYYNQIAVSSLIISIFVGIIIAPIIILGLIFITSYKLIDFIHFEIIKKMLVKLITLLSEIIIKIAEFGSNLPFNKIYVTTPSVVKIILYYLLILSGVFIFKIYHTREKTPFRQRVINLINLAKYRFNQDKKSILSSALIIILVFNLIKITPKNLNIYFIDVNQGDACLIVTPKNNKILIDGGGDERGDFDIGKNIVLPYLLDRGIKSLDYAIISHFDFDHCGTILYLMQELKIENIIIGKQFEVCENYENFEEIAKKKKINVYAVEAGTRLNIEKDLFFDVLWPNSENVITDNVLNNNSLVCKLEYKNFSVLFTGDIEEKAERRLISEYQDTDMLKSTILKVAHHGSKTSSSKEFLELVEPQVALIGVGEKNLYGHPSIDVVNRLDELRHRSL